MKQYELVEQLGSGGMGEVYRARLPAGDGVTRVAAVKKIRAELAGEHGFARFAREARMASRLGHPNIVPVLDFGRDDAGCPLLIMELVEGLPLARVIDAGTLPPLAAVIHVVTEMLRGLGHAHRAGLVHCDVSPSNVLIGWDGSVKITDFGVARAAGPAHPGKSGIQGTPGYMSPEQLDGPALDGRADLFSTGVILYELLTGSIPFAGDSFAAVAMAVLSHNRPGPRAARPEVPADLDAICVRLLQRMPENRYATARDAIDALLGYSHASPCCPTCDAKLPSPPQ